MYKYLPIFICFLVSYISSAQSFKTNKSVGVTLSLPIINGYSYYGFSETETKEGLFGIGASVFYKHNRFKYSINGAMTTVITFTHEASDASKDINVNLIEGLVHYSLHDQFNLIGGINFSNYQFSGSYFNMDSTGLIDYSIKRNDRTMGLTIGAELIFTPHLTVAAFYRPSLYCFDKKSFKQMFSLDFRFDINLWRRK